MKQGKRITAMIIAASMICSSLPMQTWAAENPDTASAHRLGLCEHHTRHTADCFLPEDLPDSVASPWNADEMDGAKCTYVCEICNLADEGALPEMPPETSQEHIITAFEPLPDDVRQQAVPGKTKLTDLNLPDTLTAKGYVNRDVASPGNAALEIEEILDGELPDESLSPESLSQDSGTQRFHIEHVTWMSDNEYDEDAEQGAYLFTAVLPDGYVLDETVDGLKLPEIEVLVGAVNRLAGTMEQIPYLDENGEEKICDSAALVTSTDSAWGSAGQEHWYVMDQDITIPMNAPKYTTIIVTGDVHLILTDGYTLTAGKRIEVQEGSSLTIYAQSEGNGMGSLIASSGIKSTKNIGDITINGGKIEATSSGGAAIGTDDSGNVASITIHGGDITAVSNSGGPGIGSYSGHAGRITITGGKVHATGGGNSAGIGSGFQGTSGTIWIGGDAEVTAVGGSYGAGIGGGYLADGGTITIEGGTVNATGGGVPSSGGTAGIGGGDGAAGGKITITGGYVEATGKAMGSHGGAGIGGGSSHNGGEITITGGTVIATGDKYGAGIGGAGAAREADGGRIRISGGNITAISTGNGAAIGGGNAAKAGDIIISGGIITAILQAQYSFAYVIGPGGNATYPDKGTFSTTEHGSAVIFCKKHSKNTREEYILGQDDPSQWNGMIFKGNQGSVYGTMVPTEDFEIPENVTLSIPNSQKLLLKNGITMTNQGTITVGDPGTPDGLLDYTDGVIHNYGSISGTRIIPGDPTWNKNEAELTLTANAQGSYGTTVDLTATVSKKTTKTRSARAIPQKTVYFYQNDQLIGTAAVNDTNQAVLSVVLEGETWKPGSYTLTASYTGGNEQLLPAKSADVSFTVTKGDPHVDAPQVKEKTAESITLQSIPGQMYCYTETTVKPNIAAAAWTLASAASLTFQNLQPDTSYYFWTYLPENDYYIQSGVSAFLEVKTEKSADQLAVEKAKELIEQAGSWMIAQETANEETSVKQWLAAQINGLNGMADTGIIVNVNDIVIVPDSFTQASGGTALDRDGTNGSFRFTVTLTKGSSSIITETREGTIQAKRFTAPVIDVGPLSSGKVGKNYEQQLTADTDGRQITWNVTDSLPAGLALEEGTGMLKGIPERSGNYTFDITARNDLGEIDTQQMSVNIVKGDAPFAEEVTKTYVYSVGGDGIVDIEAIFADVEKPNGYSHDVEDLSGIIVSSSMQDGNLLFTVKEGMLHASAAIKVTVSFSNYESTTVTVKISLTDKIPLDITSTVKDVIYTGQPYAGLGEILANGYQGGFDNVYTGRNNTVYNSTMPPSQAGDYTVTVLPSDPAYSGEWKGNFIIHKAAPLGQPEYKEITSSGRTLEDAELTVGTLSPNGTIQWILDPKTTVEYKTAYEWKFTPDNINYEELTGTIVLWEKRNDGSSGGSGGSFNARNAANGTASGTWKQDKIGWWFQKKDGSYPKNQWLKLVWNGRSDWYYFDAQGYMVQGWFTDSDGRIYFLHDVGDNTRGHMYTGWHWIKGADGKSRCYYFETEAGKYLGHLYTNQQTPDGYTVSKNGTWTVNGVEQIR